MPLPSPRLDLEGKPKGKSNLWKTRLKTTERAVSLDNKLITNHGPRVPVLARFSSGATFLPMLAALPRGNAVVSCPRAAPFPSSQTLESAGPRPLQHARWRRLPTPQPTETDVTWASPECRPFSALPCLLDPGERCLEPGLLSQSTAFRQEQPPHEGSSPHVGPACRSTLGNGV